MPEVPRQRGPTATAFAGLQPGHLLALHRAARGDGGLVADQPATEADQDRGACRPSRPRHHLPAGRGGRHRPDGARHPRRDSSIASATAMCVTAIDAQTERNRQDRSARRAEKHRPWAKTQRLPGPIHPVPAVCATADTAQGEKHSFSGLIQATLPSSGWPLGEFRVKRKLCTVQ